jgi:aryl-alcohol dehydrogenase-like predicted oxidoreductase
MRRRSRLPRPSDRIAFGRTGIRVSPLCVGLVDDPTTVPAAFDAGINFFFLTADLHWPVYEATRRGLARLFKRGRRVRAQTVVAVCSYATQPEFPAGALAEVVDAVPGLGHIDLAVMGGAYADEMLERLPVFEQMRAERYLGITAIGASFHDRQAALTAVNHDLVDLAFIRYNPAHPGARHDLLPHLKRSRRAPVFNFTNTHGYVNPRHYKALGLTRDFWRPAVTDYHRFALTRPEIDGLLCAPATPAEITGLIAALRTGPLDAEEEQYLIDLAELADGRARLAPEQD